MKPMAIKLSRRLFVSLLASLGAVAGAGAEEQTRHVVGIGTPPAEGAVISSGPYASQPISNEPGHQPDLYLSQKSVSPASPTTDRITYRRFEEQR
jgi:hypothetical protein